MKCCKRGLTLAVVLGIGVAILAATSWGAVAKQRASAWFHKQIPMETQLDEVKVQISKLDSEIYSGWPKIAMYENEINDLRKDLENKQKKVSATEGQLSAAADDLENKVQRVKFGNREYSLSESGRILNQQANFLVALKREVASKSKLLNAREQKLTAAMATQKEMISQKSRLQAEVAQIEADLETLRYAQAESKLPTGNNTRLDEIKSKIRDLQTQINVQKRTLELQNSYNPNPDGEVVVPTKDDGEAREEVIRKIRAAVGDESRNVAKDE